MNKKEIEEKYLMNSKNKLNRGETMNEKEPNKNQKRSKNPDHRYIGKVKEIVGKYGPFSTIYLDNTDNDNSFNTGSLVWVDKETGKTYQVIQLSLQGVNERAAQNGFTNSIRIDLGNDRSCKEIK